MTNPTDSFIAHILPESNKEQLLKDHLLSTAENAKQFCKNTKWSDWAYVCGLLHDVGKFSIEFQKRIRGAKFRVDHSTAGAQLANREYSDEIGKILAYIIAGHHAGLPDWTSDSESCLNKRLKKSIKDYSSYKTEIHKPPELHIDDLPFMPLKDAKHPGFSVSFFIRMLYSCLVDADFLDTESFMTPKKADLRENYPKLEDMKTKFDKAMAELHKKHPDEKINKTRTKIFEQCLSAANNNTGLFSLTVPTGGGKTLSSMAFAINHAIRNHQERIIYVIPYTSIIEQNADVFRENMGNDAVIEHHSNFDPKDKKWNVEDKDSEDNMFSLGAENWNAPLIVTTNVQFFESLFSYRSSRCRKLHNIMNSVVILDEAQMLPVNMLRPCLEALRELVEHYNTSIVLCTATQPALSSSDSFINGLDNVKEIIPEPEKLYSELKRVDVKKLNKLNEISNEKLAEYLKAYRQVLCVVNTRKQARELYKLLGESDENYHLSALMCPVHRDEVLDKIRKKLKHKKPCRVISTQLIEAGVDIDFPVVYRAMAGIDSIAQAAGRCNRENKLKSHGEVFVFMPEDGIPPGHIRQTAQSAETVFRHYDDVLSLESIEEFFRDLYWTKGEALDQKSILQKIEEGWYKINFSFRDISKDFRIIEDDTTSIIIPYEKDGKEFIEKLKESNHPSRELSRKAQKFSVNVRCYEFNKLIENVLIEDFHNKRYWILTKIEAYNSKTGLQSDTELFDPKTIV